MEQAKMSRGLHTARKGDRGAEQSGPLSVVVGLDDLIPDRVGAVVLQTDGERLEILLEDWTEVLTRGIAPEDTRSEHFDVSGMDFVTFSNGVTLFFPAGDILITLKKTATPKTDNPAMPLFQLIDHELDKEPYPQFKRRPAKDTH